MVAAILVSFITIARTSRSSEDGGTIPGGGTEELRKEV
jgi:hypothetical protein